MGGTLADAARRRDRSTPSSRALSAGARDLLGDARGGRQPRRRDACAIRRELDDVDVGVVRAVFGVAETGSVWLSEREFGVNALGFLSQHLVVLLDPRAIVADLHDAYRQPGFFEARYAVLMTGPSATADIEGVLVRGAQGIRSLTVVAMPAPEPAIR